MAETRSRLIGVLTIRWLSLLVDDMCSAPAAPTPPPFRAFMGRRAS